MEISDEAKISLETIKAFIQKNRDIDLSPFLKNIVKDYLKKEQEIIMITAFFGKIYDELYYDIIIKNIKVHKSVFRMLEALACPEHSKTDTQWTNLINKIMKKK
jgi:hypothetical protein